MWWQYLLVFLGAFLFDITPFPFAPAFTIMVFLQIVFNLNVWWVIVIGVAGSTLGRYLLLLYTPLLSTKYLKKSKNEDIQFLGEKMNENRWKGILVVLAYSLLPLPTTPLFLGAGISRMKAIYIIPPFLVGKFTSDSILLHLGEYVSQNTENIFENLYSWESIFSLFLGFLMIFCLFFINWRKLVKTKKLELDFRIFQ
jgi:membrane protein DedA with SNARE-associated domain